MNDFEAARKLISEHGYLEAKRIAEQWRDSSSPSTATFAMHNALVKEIHKCATVGKLE